MTTTITTYRIHYVYFGCFDDGYQLEHDLSTHETSIVLADISSDIQAQLVCIDPSKPWWEKEHCYHGRVSYPTKIVKIVHEEKDGWERTTETTIPIPKVKVCVCGRKYWEVKGERACHKVVPA